MAPVVDCRAMQKDTSPKRILVTGFEPFDGRIVNASAIAANSINAEHVESLVLPVQWQLASNRLTDAVSELNPELIVCLGEGRPGWFDLETRARNTRGGRADNHC